MNLDNIEKCIVKYHRNRVYFAFPIDGSTELNAIAVYNSLNSVWESIDTFQNEEFKILDMETLGRDLYVLTNTDLYLYNSQDSDNGYSITSRVRTRDYALQSEGCKKVRSWIN